METAFYCVVSNKGEPGAAVSIHNRTLKHNITVTHINRLPNGILLLSRLFLRLYAWLRGTTEGPESWMAHGCCILTSKKKKCFHLLSDFGK